MIPCSHFLLIVNRAESIDGGWIPAMKMAHRRLAARRWALYANTPHRTDIAPGDEVIVYVAGSDANAMCFVARASVAQVVPHGRSYSADGDALTDLPVAVLELCRVKWLDNPVRMAAIKDALSFVPKGTKMWGGVLQRGVRRLSAEDAAVILRGACS